MGPRSRSLFLRLLPLAFFFGSTIADVKPYISTAAEINTECKTCPHTLCTNQLAYSYTDALNVTCWTRGTKIVGDNLWLKSDLGCYVTQYDVLQYAGDYTKDLAYCGKASEDEHLTTEDATLQYKTECRACPQVDCDVAAYLPEETDVTLTCWTDQAQIIIDDPYWMKTTNNCYVAEKGLYSKPDRTYLDNCGPIPFLELANHYSQNGTTEIDKRGNASAKYLINVTVGADYAYCHSCPNTKCESEKRYKFNEEVWLQCLYEDKNSTWWSETTDFCYVKNSDFWQSPEGDYYGNPLCEYFEDSDDGSDKHVLSIVRFGRWLRSLM